MKKASLYLFLAILFIGGIFTSCDNFLKAEELKNQIEAQIAYANAATYTITVNYDSAEGQLRKPAWGEVSVKETDTFDVKFEPAKDHAFYKWEATSVDLPAGANINDYIEFENALLPETKVTFKKALSNVVLKASCPHLPYTNLTITGNNGKFSPSKGTYPCIDTMTYQLTFDADNDFEFIRWELYNKTTSQVFENGTYINIADINEADTTYTFVSVPEDPEIVIAVRPVVVQRPQTISCIPIYGIDTTVDNSIQVIFDHDMDERYVYYTPEEKEALLESGIKGDDLLFVIINNEAKYYGYIERIGTKQRAYYHFKNITITDGEGSNLLAKFDPPLFENPRMLSISPKKNELLEWMEICVTLDKNFFYEKDGKEISMPLNTRWLYMITNGSDTTPPGASGVTVKKGNTTITGYTNKPSSLQAIEENKISINATLYDADSGPASDFIMELKKDGTSTTKRKSVSFQTVSSHKAIFNGDVDFFGLGLQNGDYTMELIFKDRAGNEVRAPGDSRKYYFKLNYTSATPVPTNLYSVSKDTNSVKLAWLPPDSSDFDQYCIKWEGRTKNGIAFSGTDTINKNKFTYIINGLSDTTGTLRVELWTKKGSTEGSHAYLDAYEFPDPTISFYMPIEDLFTIQGNTVVTGRVARGIIYTSDTVDILGADKDKHNLNIEGIEMFRKALPSASAGDNIGIYLGTQVNKTELTRGMIVCKPGEFQCYNKFKAYIYNSSTNKTFSDGYRPQFYLNTTDVTGTMAFSGSINSGEEGIVTVTLIKNMPIYEGQEFTIREGGYVRGSGIILQKIE